MAKRNNGNDFDAYLRRRRSLRRHRASSSGSARGVPLWLKLAIALGGLGAIGAGVAAVAGLFAYRSYADGLVAPDELAINQPSYGAVITDRNGKVLYTYVDDKAGLRRPTDLADVSDAFLAATIATEDSSFFTNPGLNINGLGRAIVQNAGFGSGVFGEGGGGSSITQQLVKNVYISEEARQERWSKEGIDRKVKEVIYALELTKRYSKDRILEWYVNQISYGGVYNGVEAASEGYFGKPAKDLTLAEAALLAGIPQSPAAYDPVTRPEASQQRRDDVLDLMKRQGRIQIGENKFFEVTQSAVDEAKATPVEIQKARFPIEAPHWVLSYIEPQLRAMLGCPQLIDMQREVIAGKRDPLLGRPGEGCPQLFTEGLRVTTTLDIDLQNQTQEIMEHWIEQFENTSNSHNGSMMIMDPKTGEILVMIGSRDYNNEAIEGKNNNATACNSPGSSFKPFVYLSAFENLHWGPGTIVLDTPVSWTDAVGNTFTPVNPLHDFHGPVQVRFALGNSLNVPANKTAAAVGPQNVVKEARKVGFVDTFRLDGCSAGGYGPAIATGGVDVTLDEMMYGYSVLASDGIMRGQTPIFGHDSDERQIDPASILKIVDNRGNVLWDLAKHRKEQQVIDPGYPYLVWSILSDSKNTCATFSGCIGIPGAALKTGTSEPYDKNDPKCIGKIGETWSFAWSPDLVVGIWAGNTDNSCVTDIVSTSIAYRAVRDTWNMARAGQPSTPYPRPADVVEKDVCVPSGMKPTDLCGKTTRDLFVQSDATEQPDTWWQRVRIDVRNGKLAGPLTPPEYAVEKTMLVPPPEWTKSDNDKKQVEEWAKALGVELAPTEISDGSIAPGFDGLPLPNGSNGLPGGGNAGTPSSPAAIYSPANGNGLSGLVQVIGRATSPDFDSYRLEFGAGTNPTSWTAIAQLSHDQQGGTLGVWDVSQLQPGQYTLRLVVEDRTAGPVTASIVVVVVPRP